MLYRMYDWGQGLFGKPCYRQSPREVVKTKRAWKQFFKRRREMCIVTISMPIEDEEMPVKPNIFVNELIEDKELVPVKKENGKYVEIKEVA